MAKKEGVDKLGIWKQKPDQGSWQAAVVISRDQTQKLPAALVEEALRANPSQLPFITGVDLGEKGFGIVKVNKVIPPTESTSQPADWQKRFSQTWTTAENLAYYAYLKQALKTSVKGNIKASATNLN
jgi:peptidyl-prolyl cis-trans isomerase D